MLFLPLLGHCGLQGLGGSYHSHVYSSVWFTHTDVSTAVMFAPPYPLLRKPPKGAAGIRFFSFSPFVSLLCPLCSGEFELAAAFPIPRRKSCKANDAGRGSIHCRKMSNKVFRKCNWLENEAAHYYLWGRGKVGLSVPCI